MPRRSLIRVMRVPMRVSARIPIRVRCRVSMRVLIRVAHQDQIRKGGDGEIPGRFPKRVPTDQTE